MALSPRLDIRQSQGLVMTPQLQQAIKLLQMSNYELEAYVDGELERNPLLERDESAHKPDAAEPVYAGAEAYAEGPETDLRLHDDAPVLGAAAESLDTDYDNLYDGDSGADRALADQSEPPFNSDWSSAGAGGGSFQENEYNLEERISADVSLRDHLLAQLHLGVRNPRDRFIGVQLIDMLDEAGYLVETLERIAARQGAEVAEVEAVLKILQGFEPAGVCARNLAECLTLQLRERNRFDPAMQKLLENLPLLARHDRDGLMKLCGVDAEDLNDMIAEVKALDPKPGLKFGGEPAQPVVPDVFVRKGADGSWMVELNNATLPKVLINSLYCTRVGKQKISSQDRAYISECLSNANWLVKSLEQRARTILKVSAELVRQQEGFFERGIAHLKPLNLRTIADAIEMHESTVSRVTANKYIATHRGIYDMKYFFTAAIASSEGGDAHSAEAVRHKIKALIDAEHHTKILSDDRLVTLLRDCGMDIARRTVAKYREALRIPSSVERRRAKRMTA
ncbi:MAG: RNA polymerase factor sigma-54 [Alphaproteobacteria bacterium]